MAQVAPFEIIAAPYEVYVAPVGTAFTDISATPSGGWTLLGTSGSKNYDEDGVTITHDQTVEIFRPVGTTAPRKAFRTEEELTIELNLVDITAAMYARILNQATVTATASGTGIGGNNNFPLLRGFTVNTFAMIIKGSQSPDAPAAATTLNHQYDIPIVYEGGTQEVTFKKDEPAMLACEFHALWDSALGFGKYRSQTTIAS